MRHDIQNYSECIRSIRMELCSPKFANKFALSIDASIVCVLERKRLRIRRPDVCEPKKEKQQHTHLDRKILLFCARSGESANAMNECSVIDGDYIEY